MESEKNTERYLCEKIEDHGGLAFKWVSPGVRGVPDRICLLPGLLFFVEVKSEGKDLEPHQARRAMELEALGQRCYMADTKEAVNIIIEGELHDQKTAKGPSRVYNRCRFDRNAFTRSGIRKPKT